MGSWLERFLDRGLDTAAVGLADESRRKKLLRTVFRWARWLVRFACGSYFLLIVALWLLMRWVGEANITLAFFLYAPQTVWLLPLPFLVFGALLLDWRSLLVSLITLAIVVFGLMAVNLKGGKEAPPNAKVLTVLTFNRGESGNTSMQPFKNATKPDIVLLQDATARSTRYVKTPGYEEFAFGDDVGEFSIVSKFPVKDKELIQHDGVPVAARFTLDWDGKPVVVYSVHFPTPRGTLRSLTRGAFLWGIIGVSGHWAEKRRSYESFFVTQIDIAKQVLARVEAETLPCLLAGDFNAPAIGHIQVLCRQKLTDAHEAAGSGTGNTFPGVTRNPLSLGGPWMRLDKVLCNAAWQPVWSQVEPDRTSQHRATAAAFALKP